MAQPDGLSWPVGPVSRAVYSLPYRGRETEPAHLRRAPQEKRPGPYNSNVLYNMRSEESHTQLDENFPFLKHQKKRKLEGGRDWAHLHESE